MLKIENGKKRLRIHDRAHSHRTAPSRDGRG